MKKQDIVISLISGEIVALYFISLIKIPFIWTLTIIFPLLSVFCLWISYLIGKKYLFVFQFAKFVLVGAAATIFDLLTLSLFIKYAGAEAGITFSLFKGLSFIIATIAKYFVDKLWAFEKKETAGVGKEFGVFFLVTIVGLFVNVGIASFVVNGIAPPSFIPKQSWANIGGIIAVLPTFIWNFVGYKFFVFKK